MNNVVKDGETSELWRALQVETRGLDEWVRRTDVFGAGVTVKPDEDPADVRKRVADELSLPGLKVKPSDVRLLDPWA